MMVIKTPGDQIKLGQLKEYSKKSIKFYLDSHAFLKILNVNYL